MFGKNEVRLKSWEGANKDLCTEIKVDVAEFGADSDGRSRYWVEQERVDLTLPMKEFRVSYAVSRCQGLVSSYPRRRFNWPTH